MQCVVTLANRRFRVQQTVYHSVQVVCAIAVALAQAELQQNLNGRRSNMSANSEAYSKLFGDICDSAVTMARCACVACNSCTCACSCRNIPEWEDTEIDW